MRISRLTFDGFQKENLHFAVALLAILCQSRFRGGTNVAHGWLDPHGHRTLADVGCKLPNACLELV